MDADHAAVQKEPLPTSGGADCTLNEAKPLLDKVFYAKQQYALKATAKSPVTVEERIATGKDGRLTITQRGCVDITATFEFAFPKAETLAYAKALERAADVLANLHYASGSLLSPDAFKGMARKLRGESQVAASSPEKGRVLCLQRLDGDKSECLTDVSLQFSGNTLRLRYVDRP